MPPSALPDFLISLTLQYILPPSSTLPPHLVSKTLRQRHQFLSIDAADDPQAYFCWPHPKQDASRVITALDSLGGQDVEDIIHERVYDGDGDTTHARVRIGDDVQVVFVWEEDGWKYHDAQPLPFPSNTHPTLAAALATGGRQQQHDAPKPNNNNINVPVDFSASRSGANTPGSDGYWNGYGTTPPSPRSHHLFSPHDAVSGGQGAEDSYWAQYASVQGTADSTIPSPVIPKPKLPTSAADNVPPAHDGEQGPDALAMYLQPELVQPAPELDGLKLNLHVTEPSPPLAIAAPLPSRHATIHNSPPVLDWVDTQSDQESLPQLTDTDDDGSEPVVEALRGLYKLWKRGRSQGGQDKEDFMALVRTTIAEL